MSPGSGCINSMEYSSDVTPGSCLFRLLPNDIALQSFAVTSSPEVNGKKGNAQSRNYSAWMSITFKVSNGFLGFGVINLKQRGKPLLNSTEIGLCVIRKGLIRQHNVGIVSIHKGLLYLRAAHFES